MAERKVIIAGQVFPYTEKAPFVFSGMSVLGAIEYDSDEDLLRCHECGNWYGSLASHISLGEHDNMTVREYKQRHGLNYKTALLCFRQRAMRSTVARKHLPQVRKTLPKGNTLGSSHQSLERTTRTGAAVLKVTVKRESAEARNKTSTCQAQIAFRLKSLAATLGRTPTGADIEQIGLSISTIFSVFGIAKLSEVKALLKVDRASISSSQRTKFGERMPWPEDYFRVDPGASRG